MQYSSLRLIRNKFSQGNAHLVIDMLDRRGSTFENCIQDVVNFWTQYYQGENTRVSGGGVIDNIYREIDQPLN